MGHGFCAAAGDRTKSGFNALTFSVTCLPETVVAVVVVLETIDEADSSRTRLALLLFVLSRLGDRRTFCTPESTAKVDSLVVVFTCSNSEGTRAITLVSLTDDGVRT